MTHRGARLLLLVACLGAGSGCAIRDFVREVPEQVNQATKPLKYTLARESLRQRDSFKQGRAQLNAGEYRLAQRSLHRALWDLERIEWRRLRLEELVEAHEALAAVHTGLGQTDWADEHRSLAGAIANARRRDDASVQPRRALAKGKAAYRAARFREATGALRQALVDLEAVTHTPARVASLEEARCYLALSHFALDQHKRAREEIRQLMALDGSVTSCRREAPPAVRALIRDVQLKEAPTDKRGSP